MIDIPRLFRNVLRNANPVTAYKEVRTQLLLKFNWVRTPEELKDIEDAVKRLDELFKDGEI